MGNFWLCHSDVFTSILLFSLSTQVEVKTRVVNIKELRIETERESEILARMDRQRGVTPPLLS